MVKPALALVFAFMALLSTVTAIPAAAAEDSMVEFTPGISFLPGTNGFPTLEELIAQMNATDSDADDEYSTDLAGKKPPHHKPSPGICEKSHRCITNDAEACKAGLQAQPPNKMASVTGPAILAQVDFNNAAIFLAVYNKGTVHVRYRTIGNLAGPLIAKCNKHGRVAGNRAVPTDLYKATGFHKTSLSVFILVRTK